MRRSRDLSIGNDHTIFLIALPSIPWTARWSSPGVILTNNFINPTCAVVHPLYRTLFVVDHGNHMVIGLNLSDSQQWIVAGSASPGSQLDSLFYPSQALLNIRYNTLVICDQGNRRIVTWSLNRNTQYGQLSISNIDCWGLAMDNNETLYVVDYVIGRVLKYVKGDIIGIVIAGGNGYGNQPNQLSQPHNIVIDYQGKMFISDYGNARVMTCVEGHQACQVVVDPVTTDILEPEGIVVDRNGTIYVVDSGHSRIIKSRVGTPNTAIVTVHGEGDANTLLSQPSGMFFDIYNNIFIVDTLNHRILVFRFQQSKHIFTTKT